MMTSTQRANSRKILVAWEIYAAKELNLSYQEAMAIFDDTYQLKEPNVKSD